MLLVVVAAMALSACAPATPEPTEEPMEEATEEPMEEETEEPMEEETEEPMEEETEEPMEEAEEPTEFVFAHTGPIRTMDAPVTWFGSTHWLTNLLYDCLIWRAPDGSGYVGQAAESWENVDPTTWRFHLRPGITFHNGEPLDAEAVKWNIDRVRTREDFLVQPQWAFVEEVVVVDDVTVDIITPQPHAYFEYDVSYNGCELLPPQYMEEVGEETFALEPVGSGPYMLTEFTPSERYVFEAWDDYWGGRPEIDQVVYQVIPEAASQVAALLAGQVDLVRNVPLPDRPRIESEEGVELITGPANTQHLIYTRFETVSGDLPEGYESVTSDRRIRQAVSHALDRELLAEVQGSARPSLLRIDDYHPEAVGQYAGEQAAIDHYDPELSRQLIADAGYDPEGGNAPKLYFDSPNVYSGGEKEVAEAAAAMLEDVGFEVELNILDRAAYYEQIINPGAYRELALISIGGGPSLIPLFYSVEWEDPGFYAKYLVEGEWGDLSKSILTETDEAARVEMWEEWWDYYVEEAGEITLYFMDAVYGIDSQFEWEPRADGWMTFRDVKLAE
jgi:peptide/nickel transport system substrate-binding protein